MPRVCHGADVHATLVVQLSERSRYGWCITNELSLKFLSPNENTLNKDPSDVPVITAVKELL